VSSGETLPIAAGLIADLDRLAGEFAAEIGALATEQEIRVAQARFLGKKGKVSELMKALDKANIAIDRKILSDLAISDPAAFKKVVETAQAAA